MQPNINPEPRENHAERMHCSDIPARRMLVVLGPKPVRMLSYCLIVVEFRVNEGVLLFGPQRNQRLNADGTNARHQCKCRVECDGGDSLQESVRCGEKERLGNAVVYHSQCCVSDQDSRRTSKHGAQRSLREKLDKDVAASCSNCPTSADLACPVPDPDPRHRE